MIKPKPNEHPLEWLDRCFDDEQTMAEVAHEIIEENLAKGIDVYLADEKGIYQLFKDGSKKYIKRS